MAKVLCIMGESGSGKTTAMRNLDPATTFYIDADKKGMSWKNWRKQYNTEAHNYIRTDDPELIRKTLYQLNTDNSMLAVWAKRNQKEYKPMSEEGKAAAMKVRTVVLDTLNGVMVGQEMRNIHVNGYGKWTDLCEYIWDIVDYCLTMRDDLTVIILCHSETISDDNGVVFTHIKTNGRKLEKMVLESKMTTVLLAKRVNGEYVLLTRLDNSTCKTPMGSFEAEAVPNDIVPVIQALEEY